MKPTEVPDALVRRTCASGGRSPGPESWMRLFGLLGVTSLGIQNEAKGGSSGSKIVSTPTPPARNKCFAPSFWHLFSDPSRKEPCSRLGFIYSTQPNKRLGKRVGSTQHMSRRMVRVLVRFSTGLTGAARGLGAEGSPRGNPGHLGIYVHHFSGGSPSIFMATWKWLGLPF